MYNENYVRHGGEHSQSQKSSPGEVWAALADFANRFMDEYGSEDEEHANRSRSYYGSGNSDGQDYGGNYYSGGNGSRKGQGFMRYRGQPRTSTGRFKKVRYSHNAFGGMEREKEEVGSMLAENFDKDWLLEKAVKEAGEFITAVAKEDEYEMFKEFCELCVLMKGVGEFVPEELEEQACDQAITDYAKKANSRHGGEESEYHHPMLDEYNRMSGSVRYSY